MYIVALLFRIIHQQNYYICGMSKAPKSRWILFIALAALWVLVIQIVPRFLPFDFGRVELAGLSIHSDYFTHFLLFVTIVFVVNGLRLKIRLIYLFPLMLIVAAVAEFVQLYIPRRTFNYFDLLANVAGVLFGIVVLLILRKIRE